MLKVPHPDRELRNAIPCHGARVSKPGKHFNPQAPRDGSFAYKHRALLTLELSFTPILTALFHGGP